ncbi:FtsK/SpoIIIE domain-containing protein [Demequina lutea]|uniref:FtsK domain-containing protein n=1 Tax=Demequina lutea TaxID=431489 RepID=A0A7Y9Z9K1_9MICO|nr:FtsK/SpoIIIE domain-containing protein [Demequina lutea]NYI40775.1 hypothetical protein [Demequina lutea]
MEPVSERPKRVSVSSPHLVFVRNSPRRALLSIVRPAPDKVRGVRLTIHHSLTGQGHVDFEVAPGTLLREVVAEFAAPRVWCGGVALDPEHEAGDWPLLAGAILSAHPRRAGIAPGALHLAAISGPDAGVVIPVDPIAAIGSASPGAVVRDDAIDAHHATVSATSGGSLRVKDHGSVNGTGVWSRRGNALSWRGRRRVATVRVGDVIAIGRTLLEARRGVALERANAPVRERTESAEPQARPDPTASGQTRGATSAALSGAMHQAIRALGVLGRGRRHDAPHLSAFPDPTRSGGWSGPIAVGGAHSVDLARAVILARGRRPPFPMPVDEPWLSWLPPALVGDGLIRIVTGSPAKSESGWTILTAETDRTTSRIGAVTRIGPVLRVGANTADALARSRAGSLPDPPPRTLHWADAAALRTMPAGGKASLEIVTGVRADEPAVPWTISLRPGFPHTVVAGAAGSGKTTLLATMAGALAIGMPPHELELVILCAGAAGPLEPYLDLPHVRAAASHVRPQAALRILDLLDTGAAFTVVIADDLDALGPDGRAVTARLEAIAAHGGSGHVHVVMATRRPTAVLTPTVRATTGTAIALRTDCESDSVEITGTAAACGISPDARGMGIVRSGGRLDKVQVALPLADRLPRVRRCGVPLPVATTLAAAARGAPTAMRRDRPAPADLARPAS